MIKMFEICPAIYSKLVKNLMMQNQEETGIHGSCIVSLQSSYYY